MNKQRSPYHRVGEPGGPGCAVGFRAISFRAPDGKLVPALLLDAGPNATELELLRTVAGQLGVRWGHDDLGWWAAVPNQK